MKVVEEGYVHVAPNRFPVRVPGNTNILRNLNRKHATCSAGDAAGFSPGADGAPQNVLLVDDLRSFNYNFKLWQNCGQRVRREKERRQTTHTKVERGVVSKNVFSGCQIVQVKLNS